jgi:hypothetical protein
MRLFAKLSAAFSLLAAALLLAAQVNTASGQGAAVGGVRRVLDQSEVRNDMKQLGIFYMQYNAETGKPPRTLADFQNYIKKDAQKLHKNLADGYYKFYPNTRPSSNVLLAHEAKADSRGHTIAVKGDGSVHTLDAAELKAALKQQPK